MKISSLIIAKILTLCGIALTCTACYAPANGEYEVKIKVGGQVTDASAEPVEGIRVAVDASSEGDYELGAAQTGADGKYSVYCYDPRMLAVVYVSAEDVDGDENGGSFAAQTKDVAIDIADYSNGYVRSISKTVNFVLEKAVENEE